MPHIAKNPYTAAWHIVGPTGSDLGSKTRKALQTVSVSRDLVPSREPPSFPIRVRKPLGVAYIPGNTVCPPLGQSVVVGSRINIERNVENRLKTCGASHLGEHKLQRNPFLFLADQA